MEQTLTGSSCHDGRDHPLGDSSATGCLQVEDSLPATSTDHSEACLCEAPKGDVTSSGWSVVLAIDPPQTLVPDFAFLLAPFISPATFDRPPDIGSPAVRLPLLN